MKIDKINSVIYKIVLKLYPAYYLEEYGESMEQTFRDILTDDGAPAAWIKIARDLPGSLIKEHFDNLRSGVVGITKRNNNIGLAVLVAGYLTLALWLLAIFTGVELGLGIVSYVIVAFFGFFLLLSGVLFVTSLVFNVKESRVSHKLSKGLKLTLISIPPIAFCYLAIVVKGLTEGH